MLKSHCPEYVGCESQNSPLIALSMCQWLLMSSWCSQCPQDEVCWALWRRTLSGSAALVELLTPSIPPGLRGLFIGALQFCCRSGGPQLPSLSGSPVCATPQVCQHAGVFLLHAPPAAVGFSLLPRGWCGDGAGRDFNRVWPCWFTDWETETGDLPKPQS